jgi:hypothetical protein
VSPATDQTTQRTEVEEKNESYQTRISPGATSKTKDLSRAGTTGRPKGSKPDRKKEVFKWELVRPKASRRNSGRRKTANKPAWGNRKKPGPTDKGTEKKHPHVHKKRPTGHGGGSRPAGNGGSSRPTANKKKPAKVTSTKHKKKPAKVTSTKHTKPSKVGNHKQAPSVSGQKPGFIQGNNKKHVKNKKKGGKGKKPKGTSTPGFFKKTAGGVALKNQKNHHKMSKKSKQSRTLGTGSDSGDKQLGPKEKTPQFEKQKRLTSAGKTGEYDGAAEERSLKAKAERKMGKKEKTKMMEEGEGKTGWRHANSGPARRSGRRVVSSAKSVHYKVCL